MFIIKATTQNKIQILGRNIEYIWKTNKRSRRIRLVVRAGGEFAVTTPRFVNQKVVEKFIHEKAEWILAKIDHLKKYPKRQTKKEIKESYKKYKNVALEIATKKVLELNKNYNFKFNKITIRNQSTRWGSCSRKGNLNFNYKIALIRNELADYLVVHELCHLKEFNHSKKFWTLVAKTIPNYMELRKELKKA